MSPTPVFRRSPNQTAPAVPPKAGQRCPRVFGLGWSTRGGPTRLPSGRRAGQTRRQPGSCRDRPREARPRRGLAWLSSTSLLASGHDRKKPWLFSLSGPPHGVVTLWGLFPPLTAPIITAATTRPRNRCDLGSRARDAGCLLRGPAAVQGFLELGFVLLGQRGLQHCAAVLAHRLHGLVRR